VLFLRKRNNKNQKCCSFGKGTTENTSAIPLEKEQQNESEQGMANTKSVVPS